MLRQKALFFKLHISCKRPFAEIQLFSVYLKGFVGYPVKEISVVGDYNKGALEILQKAFKPFDAVYIKVVSWLVKENKVGVGKKELAEADFCPLTSAEVADGAVYLLLGKPETQKG